MSFHFPETISQIHKLALAHEKAVVIKSLHWDLVKEVSLICGKPKALWDNGAVVLMIVSKSSEWEKHNGHRIYWGNKIDLEGYVQCEKPLCGKESVYFSIIDTTILQ